MVEHRITLINEFVVQGIDKPTQQLKAYNTELKNTDKTTKENTESTKGFLKSFTEFRWALVNAFLVVRMFQMAWKYGVMPAVEYETALANVEKTTNMTHEQVHILGEELKNLSTIMPISAKDLADIAAVAGQLGITGEQNISQFTAAIATISTATGMAAEEAAKNMAKISMAFGLPISQVTQLGATINQLENTTAATAQEISDALVRVGATGKTMGISLEQSSAAVTTLISAGMGAERAGTRLRSLFEAMATKPEAFAQLAQMDVKEYVKLLETNADRALMMTVEGLNSVELRSQAVGKAIDAAGSTGGFALITLSDNVAALNNNMATAQERAININNLIKEMGVKSETTSGQIDLLKNSVTSWLLDEKGFLADAITGFRMMWETKNAGQGAIEEFNKLVTEEGKTLADTAKQAGYSEEEIKSMFDEIYKPGRRLTFVLDDIRRRMELIGQGADKDQVLPFKKSIEDIEEEITKFTEKETSLSDATRAYTLDNKHLQSELNGVESNLSRVRDEIDKLQSSIKNITSRRFNVRGLSETNVSYLIKQQELELNKAKFATLGLGDAETFLRNSSLLTADGINAQTEAVQRLIQATDMGQDRYEAWKNSLTETIRSLMINSQNLDKDVTAVVRNAQTELLSFTQGETTKSDKFTAMENNINALKQAQDIFFGTERDQLQYSEQLREDRVNGMNESAAQAISALESERGALSMLEEEERKWMNQQKDIRAEMEANKNKINEITDAYYAQKEAADASAGRTGSGGVKRHSGGEEYTGPIYGSTTAIKAQWASKQSDFVMRPGSPVTPFSPEDTIIGVKNPNVLNSKNQNITIVVNGSRSPQETAIEVKRQLKSLA